jgi:hypothetical protein
VGRALPERVHLPSGRKARLSERAARAAAESIATSVGERAVRGGECLFSLEVLKAKGVLFEESGLPIDPLGLTLRDANVLRAILAWASVVPEAPGSFTCMNCGAAFDVAPSSLLEVGPFIDGELDDPDLDAPFAFGEAHPIPAVRVGSAVARRIRFAERTVEDALPLWRASAGDRVLRITPAVVIAMGVTALGRERRATDLADALAGASRKAWGAIVDLFHSAHYPARLVGVYRCASCDARNDLDVPLERELDRDVLDAIAVAGDSGALPGPFPDLEGFEAKVREAAGAIYRARGVKNIDLFIDAGVPACDDGGEPLLGCYTPGTPPGADFEIAKRPEIRLFYRSFRAEQRADPTFDIEDEIHETIDHEVTHHLHYLSGEDPLDDAERTEIAIERARLVGRREVARRAARTFTGDLSGFLRATWPLWIALAVAAALAWSR